MDAVRASVNRGALVAIHEAAERLDVVRHYPLDCSAVIVHGTMPCRIELLPRGYTARPGKSSPTWRGPKHPPMTVASIVEGYAARITDGQSLLSKGIMMPHSEGISTGNYWKPSPFIESLIDLTVMNRAEKSGDLNRMTDL